MHAMLGVGGFARPATISSEWRRRCHPNGTSSGSSAKQTYCCCCSEKGTGRVVLLIVHATMRTVYGYLTAIKCFVCTNEMDCIADICKQKRTHRESCQQMRRQRRIGRAQEIFKCKGVDAFVTMLLWDVAEQ